MGVKKLLKRTRAHKKPKGSPVGKTLVKNPIAKNEMTNSKKKKTMVISQEIKFARLLASNDKKARAKMLKNLKAWITVRSQSSFVFTETDFMRLWKGLFYCMWMSDKPLVQEELAESISSLIHCFDTYESAVMYTKCALRTLSTEWFGIDQYRLDKFQMLVRRILRQTFTICRNKVWDENWAKGVANVFEEILLDTKGSIGFKFHVTEIFMEELAKVCEGEIPEVLVTELLRPFAMYLATMEDERQIRNVVQHIFRYLIFQSDVGIEYAEKFDAWRKAGYPTGSIEAMKKVDVSDTDDSNEDEIEEKSPKSPALDPRAGRVNVDLPQIPFDPLQIANLIKHYKFHPSSTTKTRRQITKLINEFTALSQGAMPLGVQKVDIPSKKSADTNPKKAALKLIDFQDELYADSAKNRGKKKRKSEVVEVRAKKLKKTDKSPEATAEKNPKKSPKSDDKQLVKKVSPKKKSLQKEFKVKSAKSKVKKMKSMKKAMSEELLDGIDDFANFKKGKIGNHDLSGSWDVSLSDEVSSGTREKIGSPKKSAIPTEVKRCTVGNKPSIIDDVRVDAIGGIPWLCPISKKIEKKNEEKIEEFKTPKKTTTSPIVTSSTKKRVKIMLQKNTAQHTSEYFKQLRLSPQIPYDANKKPRAGVLKPSPLASPVNPFYKKL